jgi:hypothetical protein
MYVFAFTHTYKVINYAASGGELNPKEIKFFHLVFFLLISILGFSQWCWQNPLPQGNGLRSVYFLRNCFDLLKTNAIVNKNVYNYMTIS